MAIEGKIHVLVVPFPAQGHINPMLQFAKRLLSENVEVTFVMTEANRARMLQTQAAVPAAPSPYPEVHFETISDGSLPPDFERPKEIEEKMDMLSKMGGLTLANLIERLNSQGKNICCIVYNSLLHWVPEIAKKFNIPLAFFWTQSCAVFSIYYHFNRGLEISRGRTETSTELIEIPGLPLRLNISDLPTFLQPSISEVFFFRLVMDQFKMHSEAIWILGNSFDELEPEELKAIKSIAPIRTIGPLIPSAFLDGRNPEDTDVGAHFWKTANCMDWLNTKEPASVVYVSFGSLTVLSKEQTQEIAFGLKASGYSFIWVIRPPSSKEEINSEENLPEGFLSEISEQSLVVPWCPQLQVLSHASVGAFMTHCGWNSTLESLSLGVPMLTFPQWSDQPTNSLYIVEKWKTGLRLNKRSADGLIGKADVEQCIRMVMESEVGVELRENALRLKKLSREAMAEGGSSDANIKEFVQEIVRRASSLSMSG